MAGTFYQLYIHIVFSVKHRDNLLFPSIRDELYKYTSGIISKKGCKPIILNGIEDHIHIFIGLNPAISISDLVRDIKNSTSKYINQKRWIKGKFEWQKGYSAFSYSHSQISRVCKYIENQQQHHQKKSFKEEYLALLQRFDIKYNSEYLFD